jgi:uncharacterized membrane protein YphA (DoxX/SURF4 family)
MLASAALLWVLSSLFRRARVWPDYLLAIVTLSLAVSFLLSNLTLEMLTFDQSTAIFAAFLGAATGRLDMIIKGADDDGRLARTSRHHSPPPAVAALVGDEGQPFVLIE